MSSEEEYFFPDDVEYSEEDSEEEYQTITEHTGQKRQKPLRDFNGKRPCYDTSAPRKRSAKHLTTPFIACDNAYENDNSASCQTAGKSKQKSGKSTQCGVHHISPPLTQQNLKKTTTSGEGFTPHVPSALRRPRTLQKVYEGVLSGSGKDVRSALRPGTLQKGTPSSSGEDVRSALRPPGTLQKRTQSSSGKEVRSALRPPRTLQKGTLSSSDEDVHSALGPPGTLQKETPSSTGKEVRSALRPPRTLQKGTLSSSDEDVRSALGPPGTLQKGTPSSTEFCGSFTTDPVRSALRPPRTLQKGTPSSTGGGSTPCLHQSHPGETSEQRGSLSHKSSRPGQVSLPPSLHSVLYDVQSSPGPSSVVHMEEVNGVPLTMSNVATAICNIDKLLNGMFERIKGTEQEIKSMKQGLLSAKPSAKKSKQPVPLIVRSETRKIYCTLLETDLGDTDTNPFPGFDIGPHATFKDESNKKIVSTLIREVQAVNPNFKGSDIRAAAYTYYQTLTQKESIRCRGLSDDRRTSRRRRERVARKLQARKSILDKSSMNDRERNKWAKCLLLDLMSSDESDGETIIVKELPWRSSTVSNFFKSLDAKAEARKSEQAKRQTKKRLCGGTSDRPVPTSTSIPSWALQH